MSPIQDRRDPQRRSAVLQRIVEWMQRRMEPFTEPPQDVAEPTVAARIIKRLAMRGLVRRVDTGWLPNPLLRAEVPIRQTDAP
jgi:hypothetical protein